MNSTSETMTSLPGNSELNTTMSDRGPNLEGVADTERNQDLETSRGDRIPSEDPSAWSSSIVFGIISGSTLIILLFILALVVLHILLRKQSVLRQKEIPAMENPEYSLERHGSRCRYSKGTVLYNMGPTVNLMIHQNNNCCSKDGGYCSQFPDCTDPTEINIHVSKPPSKREKGWRVSALRKPLAAETDFMVNLTDCGMNGNDNANVSDDSFEIIREEGRVIDDNEDQILSKNVMIVEPKNVCDGTKATRTPKYGS